MAIAKMETTMVPVTMMAVTVVYLIPIQTIALNVFAITRRFVQLELLIPWLEMDSVKMKSTMLTVTMMGETVVYLAIQAQINVHNAYVTPMELSPHLVILTKITS